VCRFGMTLDLDRETQPVVLDGRGAVGMERHGDPAAAAGAGFIERSAHHLLDEVTERSERNRSIETSW